MDIKKDIKKDIKRHVKRTIYSVLSITAMVIFFIGGSLAMAQADNLQKGISAFKNKDYDGAITAWELSAASGEVVAMYNLGRIYSDKNINKVDLKRSIYWYEKAAVAGNVEAQFNIGWIMLQPKTPVHNPDKAIQYWITAADRGHVPAMRGLANLYMMEKAPWYNQNNSLKYLTMAARAGDPESQKMVEQLRKQFGVKPKAPTNKKAPQREATVTASPKTKPKATPQQREQQMANKVKSPSLTKDEPVAENKAALQQEDFDLALHFIERADGNTPRGQGKDVESLKLLFLEAQSMYSRGQKTQAIELMRTLALRGYTKAYFELAQYEFSKEGTLSADSIYFLSLAAEMGNNRAQILLGDYLINKPTKIEQNRGWYWLTKAYAKNDAEPSRQLSRLN